MSCKVCCDILCVVQSPSDPTWPPECTGPGSPGEGAPPVRCLCKMGKTTATNRATGHTIHSSCVVSILFLFISVSVWVAVSSAPLETVVLFLFKLRAPSAELLSILRDPPMNLLVSPLPSIWMHAALRLNQDSPEAVLGMLVSFHCEITFADWTQINSLFCAKKVTLKCKKSEPIKVHFQHVWKPPQL